MIEVDPKIANVQNTVLNFDHSDMVKKYILMVKLFDVKLHKNKIKVINTILTLDLSKRYISHIFSNFYNNHSKK